MERGFSSVTTHSKSTFQSVSARENATVSKSQHSDKRQRFSVKALHDSLHLLKGNMMEIINVIWERDLVSVYVCVRHPLLTSSLTKHKWKKTLLSTNVIGGGRGVHLGFVSFFKMAGDRGRGGTR